MGNIVDYVIEYSDIPFNVKSFSTEDALALCQFSYLKFDFVLDIMSSKTVSIKNIEKHPQSESMFSDPRYEKDNRKLFTAMASSKRFSDIELCFYINRIEVENETQFAAVTMFLPGGDIIIVFRGTDENMVGWQEDFGLALKKPIMGQKLSAGYMADVYRKVRKPFFVAGHSKGGNLALYSAMSVDRRISKKIKKIFCFDGPGFRSEFLSEHNYAAIKDRIVKVIPKSSVVGLLLDTDENSMVVKAKQLGVSQHKIYNWVIEDGSLVKEEMSEGHEMIAKTVNDWILSQPDDKLERFTDFLDHMLESSQADTTVEFSNDFYRNSISMIKTASEIDDDTKDFLSLFIKSYFELAKDIITDDVMNRVSEKTDSFMDMVGNTTGEFLAKIENARDEVFSKTAKKKKEQ